MIKFLTLESYKGFSNTTIEFSNITCIIGENSTGKSTIIEAIRDLLSSNTGIRQNDYKVGINDKNTTSLSLVFQDGRKLGKNIQDANLGNALPECLTDIDPIRVNYSFPLKNNNPDYGKPIKDCNIQDIAWRNILSHCDFTLRTAAESTTDFSDAWRFNEDHTVDLSEKFTNTFNNILEDSIGRKYKFRVFFECDGSNLVVKLQIRYSESHKETNKESSWVDLNYESEGFRILMALCSYLFNDQDKSKKIFVMDEPFTNIHPKAQRQVSRMLQSLSQRFQIIYATHSPHLLPERDKIICTLAEAAGDLSICGFEEYPLNLFYDLSPLALDTIEEIKKSDSAINVIPEGATDDKIYRRLFKIEGISDKIHVVGMGGSGNLENRIRSFATINKPSLFILDPNEKVRKLERSRELIAKHDHLFLLELPYQKGNHVKKGIENLIPNHIIEKASKVKNQGVQLWIKNIDSSTRIEEYVVVNKKELAEFFVNEVEENDYQFFSPVIDKIKEIQNSLCEN
ncbi:hypothetical protein C6500_07515 [Candidatus Poribacteria bacterium]|nr:MAG: hypothetical protein C6500_07515 [Candidatus Poribacteria bacterium]